MSGNYQSISAQGPYRDPYYNSSTGYLAHPGEKKKGVSNWIKFGVPVGILIIVGAVVGAVLGVRASKNNNSNGSGGSGGGNAQAAASSAASAKQLGVFATATDAYFNPVYPSATSNAAFSSPTFIPSSAAQVSWGADSFKPGNPSATTVRTDRPRLIAPAYKWAALPNLIAKDPYLKAWNDSVINNATQYAALPPVKYVIDGSSGALDIARETKERLKAFSYAYRVTNDTKWVDRCWQEILNAAGNTTNPFGQANDRWNSQHFLDVAEFTAGFAIAYDWLNDVWKDDQKAAMRSTMIQYGLSMGIQQLTSSSGWWAQPDINGNWNCVCNSGLSMGALAILGDDTTGTAEKILGLTIPSATKACVNGPSSDGTWDETANYWYFGNTGHAEMTSSLITATGSDYGMLNTNTNYWKTGLYHLYVYGMTSLFNYGDHGPNKFSTTANAMMFYGTVYSQPTYTLFQRDRFDATGDPFAIFWYDPTVSGAFWDGLPLDRFFSDNTDQWASMRTSWTDNNGAYIAIKAGTLQGHQTHNDLDVGDFVIDALGQRWAGELGSGDYNSPDYFTSDDQNATRWLYYRKRTEGQNTLLIDQQNQQVSASPKILKAETTNETQGASTQLSLPSSSTAYWTADITSAYGNTQSIQRGIRFINGRKQILLQDDINTSGQIMWRMHTNATVNTNGNTATLTLNGQTMQVQIINGNGATFGTMPATRLQGDPTPPAQDQDNPGVTVLTISLQPGQYNLQVLFNPQWSGMSSSDFKTPSMVPVSQWSLTSHD